VDQHNWNYPLLMQPLFLHGLPKGVRNTCTRVYCTTSTTTTIADIWTKSDAYKNGSLQIFAGIQSQISQLTNIHSMLKLITSLPVKHMQQPVHTLNVRLVDACNRSNLTLLYNNDGGPPRPQLPRPTRIYPWPPCIHPCL
jgi:hypothetical protein